MDTINRGILIGDRYLTGVDFERVRVPNRYTGRGFRMVDSMIFSLLDRDETNPRTFLAVEDPDDGYRSCLEALYVRLCMPPRNRFEPVPVRVQWHPDGANEDVIQLVNPFKEGRSAIIMEIGTSDYDNVSYCVLRFSADAIGTEQEREHNYLSSHVDRCLGERFGTNHREAMERQREQLESGDLTPLFGPKLEEHTKLSDRRIKGRKPRAINLNYIKPKNQ